MSETIEQIKERIAGDYSDLSKVSLTRHFTDIVAVAYRYLTDIFSIHKLQVQQIADSMQIGTFEWWRQQMFLFQYGYNLSIIDYRSNYETIDEDARIIKYCYVIEQIDKVVIKIAKYPKTELLTQDEEDAILDYIFKIKYPGTKTMIVNQLADEITLSVDVYVNHEIIEVTGNVSIKVSIIAYINNSEFGGIITVNALIDYIQSIDGVKDLNLKQLSADTSTGKNTVIYNLNSGINEISYESESGHYMLPSGNLTLNLI